jgi:choline dehydrogenase
MSAGERTFMKTNANSTASLEPSTPAADFAQRVHVNQARLTSELKPHYDFIVCGSGSSGSVVARRLAENPDVSILLLEAGGTDDMPSVMEAGQWPANLGSDRDWAFQAQPNPHLNGRAIPMNMGKILGGGSSINLMAWSRGHKNDWDYFASEAGDPAWTQNTAVQAGRFLSNPRLTVVQLRWPCLTERGRSESQPLKIRTVA